MEKKIIMTESERKEFDELQKHFCKSPSECIRLARLTALTVLTSIEEHNGDIDKMVESSFVALRYFKA